VSRRPRETHPDTVGKGYGQESLDWVGGTLLETAVLVVPEFGVAVENDAVLGKQ